MRAFCSRRYLQRQPSEEKQFDNQTIQQRNIPEHVHHPLVHAEATSKSTPSHRFLPTQVADLTNANEIDRINAQEIFQPITQLQ